MKVGRWGEDVRAPLVGFGGEVWTERGMGYFVAVVRVGEGVLVRKVLRVQERGSGREEMFWEGVRVVGKGAVGEHGGECCVGQEGVKILPTYWEEGGSVREVECRENGVVIEGWRKEGDGVLVNGARAM